VRRSGASSSEAIEADTSLAIVVGLGLRTHFLLLLLRSKRDYDTTSYAIGAWNLSGARPGLVYFRALLGFLIFRMLSCRSLNKPVLDFVTGPFETENLIRYEAHAFGEK
jgi:hypothetical protein